MNSKLRFPSVLGFFEEFYEYEKCEFLGTRVVEWPNRTLGTPGTIDVVITENITLKKGHKEIVHKASTKKPLKCRATLQMLCGVMLNVGDKVKVRRQDGLHESGTIKSFNDDFTITLKSPHDEWIVEAWKVMLCD